MRFQRVTPSRPKEVYIPDSDKVGLQSNTNHQTRVFSEHSQTMGWDTRQTIEALAQQAFNAYNSMLEYDAPLEIARLVLPLGTYTRFFAKVDLNNLIRFLKERLDNGAQYEIRVYAHAIAEMIEFIVPTAYSAFLEYHHDND